MKGCVARRGERWYAVIYEGSSRSLAGSVGAGTRRAANAPTPSDSRRCSPLEELWVTSELLGLADTLEAGTVVIVLDLPADELPSLARHPASEWDGDQLRLGKRSLLWCYRPLTWPV